MRLTVPPPPTPPPFPPFVPGPRAPLQPPMVYVAPVWEYKHLYRAVEGDTPPVSEEELNALGAEGWELSGLIAGPTGVHLYFKRAPA
jgi:hypothetical protein